MSAKQLRIRETPNHITVERRSQWAPLTTFLGTFIFLFVLGLITPGKTTSQNFLQIILKSDAVTIVFMLLFLGVFSTVLAWGVLKISRAEFLHCDAMRFHYGRKGLGRTWARSSYSRHSITRLRWGQFSIDRNTAINCLMFEIGAYTEHVLEGLTLVEADQILTSCQRFGYDVFRDESVPMLLDIEKRGWFVNPWRPDEAEAHPKEQQ